jgi:hypothetical protein
MLYFYFQFNYRIMLFVIITTGSECTRSNDGTSTEIQFMDTRVQFPY